MNRLRSDNSVKVYHEVDDEGNHFYWFYEKGERIDLDWGETGHIPNCGDRFPHPKRDIDLRLDDILWADDP
jgi:hypothetical protein